MKNSVSKWFFKLKLEKSQWKGTSKICMVIKFVIERFKKKKKKSNSTSPNKHSYYIHLKIK